MVSTHFLWLGYDWCIWFCNICRYHGEKLSSFLPLKKPRKDFHISTVYDEPKDIDKGDEVLRRQPGTSMKYRASRGRHEAKHMTADH